MKRTLTIVLVLTLLCSCISGISAASRQTIHLEKTLDPRAQVRSDITLTPAPQPRTVESDGYIETVAEGAEVLRNAMKDREDSCVIYVCVSDWSDEFLSDLADALFIYALDHTGVPDEGDYLAMSIMETSVAIDGEVEGDLGYFALYYEIVYATTAAQERQVDDAVDQILDQLDLSGKNSDEKLRAIYDYIWNHVQWNPITEANAEDVISHTAFSGLVNGSSTCLGISTIVYRLALEAEVDCRVIVGSRDGDLWLWNIVQIGTVYFNMDAANNGSAYGQFFLKRDASMDGYQRDEAFRSTEFNDAYPMCNKDYTEDGCPHSYTNEFIEPTCTEDGYMVSTCSYCGHSYIEQEIGAYGHDFGEWEMATAPTCTKNGKMERRCTICDAAESKTVPTMGHNYENGACTECGRRLSEGVTVPQTPVIRSCYSVVQTSMKTTWELVEGADGYELWRSSTPDDPYSWTKTKTINSGTKDRYTNQGLTVGVTYYYKVRAFVVAPDGSKVYSPFSEMRHQPAAVVFGKLSSGKPDRINVTWNKVEGCHGYQIWRLLDNGKWKLVKTLGDKGNTLTDDQGDTTIYTNSGLPTGSTQTYKMRAFYIWEDGRKSFGAYSDEATTVVRPNVPKFSAVSDRSGEVFISWERTEGITGYEVTIIEYGSKSHTVTYESGNSHNATGLNSGETVRIKMRCYIELNGERVYSGYTEIRKVVVSD